MHIHTVESHLNKYREFKRTCRKNNIPLEEIPMLWVAYCSINNL